jgi:hypothetical protein
MTCLLAAVVVDASAQEKGSPASPAAATTTTPLKLQVVMTRYDGDKKVSSMPYTTLINASEPNGKPSPKEMTMGVQVPLTVTANNVPTVVFKDVGVSIKGNATSVGGGRYRLALFIEQAFVAVDPSSRQNGITAGPVLRTFRDIVDVVLRDGQTTQTSSATDPVTGEVLKVDLTLVVVK